MSEVLHANIFFIIASIATVIFSILVCFILYQVYKIVKLIRSILERVESASEMVAEDVAGVRQLIANGGMLSRILSLVLGSTSARRTSRRSKSSSDIS